MTWMKGQKSPQQVQWQHKAGRSGQHPRGLCSPSEGPRQFGGMGREETFEIQQRWVQDAALGEK